MDNVNNSNKQKRKRKTLHPKKIEGSSKTNPLDLLCLWKIETLYKKLQAEETTKGGRTSKFHWWDYCYEEWSECNPRQSFGLVVWYMCYYPRLLWSLFLKVIVTLKNAKKFKWDIKEDQKWLAKAMWKSFSLQKGRSHWQISFTYQKMRKNLASRGLFEKPWINFFFNMENLY